MFLGNGSSRTGSRQAAFAVDKNAYDILGVDRSSSDQEIKEAYHTMAQKYHPDKVAHLGTEFTALAEEKFKSINDAYRRIKEERRF